MNGSQESLRDYYQASCQEINDVVEIARANGALGSRFTGEFSFLPLTTTCLSKMRMKS